MGSRSDIRMMVYSTNCWYKVICEPVPAGLTRWELESEAWGWDLVFIRGFPPKLGIQTWQWGSPRGRQLLSHMGFPEARLACWEAPETLRVVWVFGSGETEVRGRWVLSPGASHRMRGKWVFPPGETGLARKTVVPQTRGINVIIIGLLLYMIGLSANSQEVLSRYMNVILIYCCTWSA